MLKKENSVFLFIGQDNPSKEAGLKRLKEDFISRGLEAFNTDVLYAKDLELEELQKRLLCLPVKSKKRILIVKQAQDLKENIREFLSDYVKKPVSGTLLVLDMEDYQKNARFIESLAGRCQISRFKEPQRLDTFSLSRQIDLKRADSALRTLNQLLSAGERPERILGGLRHVYERDTHDPLKLRKKIRLMLDCDIQIKTGKLKPGYALERLVVRLCAF
ncbi:MAG: hypothetical protein JW788_06765 [Candidatus Omnitrophica bacterium]|nr:hypothetical protein [Candidatus Omnitrophota bacterium]